MKKQLILAVSLFTVLATACEDINPNVANTVASNGSPAIYSFNPESAECGTEIVLQGENFGMSVMDNFVTFDRRGSEALSGRIAEVTAVSYPGAITVRIPMNLEAGEYNISLLAKGKAHTTEKVFEITDD